jgi:hypothetical protein
MTPHYTPVSARDKRHKRVKRALIFLSVCLLINFLVMGIYFWKFAPGHMFELSSDQDIWAQFGTFYSGMMTPLLSLAAFVGILFTIVLQARQLDHAKEQFDDLKRKAQLEEIQRVIGSVAATVDGMLNSKVPLYASKRFIQGNPEDWTLSTIISALGYGRLTVGDESRHRDPNFKLRMDATYQDSEMAVNAVVIEFESMAWCMNTYRKNGGSEDVLGFYSHRYGPIVGWLKAMDEFHAGTLVEAAFDIPNILRGLTPRTADEKA